MMQGIRRWRNIPGMRTLFILLALSPNLVAQGLSAADVAEIRSAIDEEGKSVNQRGSGEVWSERGPGGYGIRSMELVLPGVAIASAVWMRPGAFPQAQPYSFILTKGDNRQWKIVRKLAVCPGRSAISRTAADLRAASVLVRNGGAGFSPIESGLLKYCDCVLLLNVRDFTRVGPLHCWRVRQLCAFRQ